MKCPNCDKSFEPRKEHQRYCSKRCRGQAWQREKKSARQPLSVTCPACHTRFETFQRKAVFCSDSCRRMGEGRLPDSSVQLARMAWK